MTTTNDSRHRTVGDLDAVHVRAFTAPRELVWAAHTRPEHVREWLLGSGDWTMPVCEIDLRPGGSWHYVWRKGDGTEMPMTGTYQEVDPPARLVFTERWGPEWPETVTTIEFHEIPGGTQVTHTIRWPSPEHRAAALRTGMDEGTRYSYGRLDGLLARIS